MSDILVAFATKAGSTEQVAAAIADALRKSGNIVDLRRARDVREPVSRWGCIVLGAPSYSGRWHRDAHRFIRRHRGELERVPVAVFGMGPRSPEQEAWQRSRSQLDRALAKRSWLTPVAEVVFGGADPPKRRQAARRDLRGWAAIEKWAWEISAIAASRPAPAAEL
jgi:menaquinone-dependent protoporphyrinogen oxidase